MEKSQNLICAESCFSRVDKQELSRLCRATAWSSAEKAGISIKLRRIPARSDLADGHVLRRMHAEGEELFSRPEPIYPTKQAKLECQDTRRGRNISIHELDAITCPLVAGLHIQGKSLALGDTEEGEIILPRSR